MKRIIPLFLLLPIVFMASAPAAAGGVAGAAETVRIGYVHVFDDAPVLVARDGGFFKAEGLDVQVTAFTSGPTLVKGLVTGELDIGVLGFTNALTWASEGADLKIVGKVQDGYHALVARADTGVKSLADLKGRRLASQKVGSTADVVLKGVILPRAGLDERDLEIVYTAPATALQSLQAGRVDAALLFEPFATMARLTAPVREIYEVGKKWPFPCMVIVASERLLKERPDLLRKVLLANKRSIEFLTGDRAGASRLLAPAFLPEGDLQTGTRVIPAEQVIEQALATQTFDWRLSKLDLARMAELAGIMKKQGALKKPVAIDEVVDLRWQQELERVR